MNNKSWLGSRWQNWTLWLLAALALSACGGGSSGSSPSASSTYSVSGTITGAASVAVALSGAASANATTDASGNYTFTGLANGSYTVTPSLAGYTFTPGNAAVTVSGANVGAVNFTAAASPSTFTISGQVTTSSGGALAGVTITLSGAGSGTQVTNSSGAFTFANLPAGSYTLTPSLAGYTFAPASDAVTVTNANVTATTLVASAAVATTYSISGTVSGAVAAGVTVSVSGAATATATTDSAGNYTVSKLANGSYTVTPSLAGYTFSPASTSVTINGASVASTNFVSSATAAPTYTISGAVSGAWVDHVTVSLSGAATGTTVTDATGHYSFTNLAAGSYTVTPSLAGYTYSPAAPTITLSANTTQNFTASSAYAAYSVSGTIQYAGSKSGPVNVWVYQSCTTCGGQGAIAGTSVTLAGSAGAMSATYTVRGLANGSYVVAAEIDTLGNGQSNAVNPAGMSTAQTVSGANVAGANITLADPATPAPAAPSNFTVAPESGTALISYQPQANGAGQELATAYKIYWGTDTAASNGGSKTFSAQGQHTDVYVLSGLTNGATYFKMSALVGTTESAPTAVTGPVAIGATTGGNTVSGTVTFPGTATGPMIVGVYGGGTHVYFQVIANPTSPQSYSVSGVPAGTYQSFAFIDQNGDGVVDTGDITNVALGDLPILGISGATTSNLTLSNADALVKLHTDHWTDGTSNSYSFQIGNAFGAKRPVAVTLYSAPNAAVPFDVGATYGDNVYMPGGNAALRPQVGDAYVFRVTYSDGTTGDVTATVSGVLDAFATSLLVNTGTPYSRNVPQFQWSAPTTPPASYVYGLSVYGSDTNWNYPQNGGLASTTTSAVYDADGTATLASLTTGTPYTWQVIVKDAVTRNTATYQAPSYTP